MHMPAMICLSDLAWFLWYLHEHALHYLDLNNYYYIIVEMLSSNGPAICGF